VFGTSGGGVLLAYLDAATGDVIYFDFSGSPTTYTVVNGSYFV